MSIKDDSLDSALETGKAPESSSVVDLLEARKKRFRAALAAASGVWKGRTDIPTDGVEYQRIIRGEWDRDE